MNPTATSATRHPRESEDLATLHDAGRAPPPLARPSPRSGSPPASPAHRTPQDPLPPASSPVPDAKAAPATEGRPPAYNGHRPTPWPHRQPTATAPSPSCPTPCSGAPRAPPSTSTTSKPTPTVPAASPSGTRRPTPTAKVPPVHRCPDRGTGADVAPRGRAQAWLPVPAPSARRALHPRTARGAVHRRHRRPACRRRRHRGQGVRALAQSRRGAVPRRGRSLTGGDADRRPVNVADHARALHPCTARRPWRRGQAPLRRRTVTMRPRTALDATWSARHRPHPPTHSLPRAPGTVRCPPGPRTDRGARLPFTLPTVVHPGAECPKTPGGKGSAR